MDDMSIGARRNDSYNRSMLIDEHTQTSRDFLIVSDAEFASGDLVQGSEKLWGAAAHAVMAVAQQRGWPHRSHRSLKSAVIRIAEERGNGDAILAGFLAAEKFHRNFYHDDMEDYERDADRPVVHRFVERMLAMAE